MDFLPEKIEKYVTEFTEKESDLLEEINRETWLKVMNPRMLSGHLQGRVLSMISKMIRPTNIIEIGTYTGYSALCMAEGLKKGGKLHTVDINEEYISVAKKYFNKSKYKENIIQHAGEAADIIPKLNDNFQLAFIDADKENYYKYFELIFEKMEIGGYIIADNVLWSGKVIEKYKDKETISLDEYNKKVFSDKRVETIVLPVRDGLNINRKISN
tara:strand:- start:65 stop:706 length:642 start_codon:yes stop_codon:yes gene_type:complete